MSTYTERALNLLKERGYRITKPRRLVVETLDKHEASLSPYDIKDLLAEAGEAIDTVSIYRIIECLEQNHLVHRLLLQNGKIKKCNLEDESHCDLHQPDHCHHFLICRQCSRIEEMHCLGLQTIMQEVSSKSGFTVEDHHLEFVGLCQDCAAKTTKK
jgi:Fe2+ or Zn2+ uptake regulation protein